MSLTKQEVENRLCALVSNVGTQVFKDGEEHDCFCGLTKTYREETFCVSPVVVEFIEKAVSEAVQKAGAAAESKAEGGNTVHSNYLRQLPGGVCFAHGGYTGMQCPQWPKCSTDLQKPEYLDQKYRDDWHAKLAAMRAEPLQPSVQGELDERANFEAWYLRKENDPRWRQIMTQRNEYDEGRYSQSGTEQSWQTWLAAKSAPSITSARIAEIAAETLEGPQAMACFNAICKALREAGVRVG